MNANRLESFVIDRIKENILTDENLTRLLELTNERLRLSTRRSAKKLNHLERQIASIERRLSRLYAALETGKVDIDDLAPRLKELRR